MDFANNIISFYRSLEFRGPLPADVEVMNPYGNEATMGVTELFYRKYFSDNNKRIYIFGINPGRNGGGVTGIPFTDPVNLASACNISHPFRMIPELSSGFIYSMIQAYGGVDTFYSRFFLTAICPLGFLINGKNYNYYDSKELIASSEDFIKQTILQQLQAGAYRHTCFCLGQGKNAAYLEELNKSMKLFDQIIALPHPRWILQYRRKRTEYYIKFYIDSFNSI